MSPSLRPLVAVLVLAALWLTAPAAAADTWADCGPHSDENKTVRVFPRAPSPAGPAGVTSELQCGNRYYGLRRIEAHWAGHSARDWRPAADAAITRALDGRVVPTFDPRSGNHTYASPGVEVVVGPRGVVVDARPVDLVTWVERGPRGVAR